MADQSSKSVVNGVLGHLPPWPRQALNNSVIGMEQAYRQRKGLPPLSDEDIAALKAGEPMPWERGEGAPAVPASTAAPLAPEAQTAPLAQAPPATTAAPAAAPPAAATAPVAAGAPKGGINPEVAKLIAEGKKWSRSAIAAEQARRNRKGLPALTDAEVNALLGEEAAAATAPAPAEARPATSAPAPAVAATAAGQKVPPAVSQTPAARGTEANKYVGPPAGGPSAAAAGGIASVGPENREVHQRLRRPVWSCVTACPGALFIAFFIRL